MSGLELFAAPLPLPADLPAQSGLPELLKMADGTPVVSKEQWVGERAPELRRAIQFYEYGAMPPKPERFEARLVRVDPKALNGKATLKELEITCFQPAATVQLLLVVPNVHPRPVACFLGMNFKGNHTLLADPQIVIPPGRVDKNKLVPSAQERAAERGSEIETWNIEQIIDRGYALASFYNGDVVPDQFELARERLKELLPPGKSADAPDATATIAAWAWGFSRMIDYLVTNPDLDPKRIAVVGHSRNGKTALLATAMDPRIAMVIPSQAGCGGTAPCRVPDNLLGAPGQRPIAETLAVINKAFPHWFCANFKEFSAATDKLPFDQHALLALCAPRPILISCAVEDHWANPEGQFELLRAADPLYRLISGQGCDATTMPAVGALASSRLGYFIRPGKHSMNLTDWNAWLDFADLWLK